MTDLPQLQEALVRAAGRRNRRTRIRSALVSSAAIVAAAAIAVTSLPGERDVEREVSATPQPSSALTPREAADRFAVLRDESRRETCRTPFDDSPGSVGYLLGREGDVAICATVGQQQICLSASNLNGFGGGCMSSTELEDFAEGRTQAASTPLRDGRLIYAVVPDGTRNGKLTYRDGTTARAPIVSWTTPSGERFTSTL
jgi:hypothetical protein